MKRLPPSGYIPVSKMRPGYLAERMKKYRAQVEAEKRKQEANAIEVREKVKTLKVKP